MVLYVDRPRWPAKPPRPGRDASRDEGAGSRADASSKPALSQAPAEPGRLWSHLISDTSYAELHMFAELLGLPRRGFHRDHYDLPSEVYATAVLLGARPVTSARIVELLVAAGLRRRKPRTGARTHQARVGPEGGART